MYDGVDFGKSRFLFSLRTEFHYLELQIQSGQGSTYFIMQIAGNARACLVFFRQHPDAVTIHTIPDDGEQQNHQPDKPGRTIEYLLDMQSYSGWRSGDVSIGISGHDLKDMITRK